MEEPKPTASQTARDIDSATPDATPVQRKEVDYYLNPTELFRWINYRRWDGAKARALSHPEECSTWIVSRHNTDGRVLWRHLPLHLVCMQVEQAHSKKPEPNPTSAVQVIEELVDVLLEAYPDAASSPDDQGMLPLHLVAANSTHPNQRILFLLLLAYPTGVSIKDQHGRTPADLVEETAAPGPAKEAAMRALARAQNTTMRLVKALLDENEVKVSTVQKTADNERLASQHIILRLEQELVQANKQLEEMEGETRNGDDMTRSLQEKVDALHKQLDEATVVLNNSRHERDDLKNQNEVLRDQINDHDHIVTKLRQNFENERQDQTDAISTLKSEVSTAKAMAEALENQLRSRFTNEEYLSNTVTNLETQISDLKAEYQQEQKKLVHERDELENENTRLTRSVDELTKKNESLQIKSKELTKKLNTVIGSHGSLNAEHDRMMEASLRAEAELIESVRNERSQLMTSMKKQWESFKSSIREQEDVLEECQRKEMDILSLAKEERDRSVEVVSKLRQDFRELRSHSVDHPHGVPNENLAPIRLVPNKYLTASPSSGRKTSPISPTSHSATSPSAELGPRSSSFESRAPTSTKKPAHGHGQREGPSEGKLVHLLNALAEEGSSRDGSQESKDEFSTLESSTISGRQRGSVRFVDDAVSFNKPRMIGIHRQDDESSNDESDAPRTRHSDIRFRRSMGADPRHGGYNHMSDGSESDGSTSRDDGGFSKGSQFSGMAMGVRRGMIRIDEESIGDDSQSQYSNGTQLSAVDSQYSRGGARGARLSVRE